MFFVGVITSPKNENFVKNELSKIIPNNNIIFINDRNIMNIKNIKFEVIVIDDEINNEKELRKIISDAKIIILNSDIKMNFEILSNLKLTIITYGFNSKSTFTVSSIQENHIIICLQRNICNNKGIEIEPQEYNIRIHESAEKYITIATYIMKIIYY